MNFKSYVGADESGKGEILGPLAVAAVFVTPATEKLLKEIGVKDSKRLADSTICRLAPQIRKIVKYKCSVTIVSPKRYNAKYSNYHNQVTMLAKIYEKLVGRLMSHVRTRNIIIDKFCNYKHWETVLTKKNKLLFVPRAEMYTGVAAASILARYEVVKWFDNHPGMYKGAAKIVHTNVEALYKEGGIKKLSLHAKLHFKSVKEFLNEKSQAV